jgi:hypothetical protein
LQIPPPPQGFLAVIADGLSKNSSDCDLFFRQTPPTMAFVVLPPHKN